MSLMRRLIWAVSLSGVSAIWMIVPARGDEPRLDRFEPDARQLLNDVAKVYRAFRPSTRKASSRSYQPLRARHDERPSR